MSVLQLILRRQWAPLKTRSSLILIAVVLGLVSWSLLEAREAARHDAEQHEGNIGLTLQHDIERVMATLDLSLEGAIKGLTIPGFSSLPLGIQRAILFDGTLAAAGSGGIRITDAKGAIAFSSFPDAKTDFSVADRPYFQFHRDHDDSSLQVTGPLKGRTSGQSVMILSRRINNADGTFGGVAVAGLRLDFFKILFNSLELDPGASITIVGDQARLIARRPTGEAGRDMRQGEILAHIAQSPAGVFEAKAKIDGINRQFVYSKVGAFPLTIAVGFATSDIYAAWWRRVILAASVLLVLVGVDLLLSHALRRELRDRLAAEQVALEAKAEAEQLAGKLASSLARREALIKNTPDMMSAACRNENNDFVYESVSPVWERVWSIRAKVAIGQTPLACLPGPVAAIVQLSWTQCVSDQRPVRFSFITTNNDVIEHWDSITCPVFEADGLCRRVVNVARNVTDQRLLQDELRDAHGMKVTAELTAGIAHDFNNLLQAIQGALDVASEQQDLDPDTRRAIGIATEAAQRAATLVHQMLAFCRKQVLASVLIPAKQASASILALTRPVLGRNHKLSTCVADETGEVLADPIQLNRCLLDLIINARDAMPRGGFVTLRIANAGPEEALEAGLKAAEHVRFIIEDEGEGMSQDTLARAFEPFFTTKSIGKGSGLGLSMVQGFARQSGGDISIKSTPGVGTSVSLWLPRAVATPVTDPKIGGAEKAMSLISSKRILVVDDDRGVLHTVSLFLRKAGFKPVVVESGEEALAVLERDDCFDLLITDQSMPGMSGVDLIEAVAHLQSDLPTMIMTGYDMVSGIERLGSRVPVLTKPFQRSMFISQVHAALAATYLTRL